MYITIILSVIIILGIICFIKNYNKKQNKKILKEQLKTLKELRDNIIASKNLIDLYHIHKRIFKEFENYYIPSCIDISKYGFFRASSRETLSPDNIFLGNIFGLNTLNLSYWNSYNDIEIKNLIINQYKQILSLGLINIKNKINNE